MGMHEGRRGRCGMGEAVESGKAESEVGGVGRG